MNHVPLELSKVPGGRWKCKISKSGKEMSLWKEGQIQWTCKTILAYPHCHKCALPCYSEKDCPWEHSDLIDRTYALVPYYRMGLRSISPDDPSDFIWDSKSDLEKCRVLAECLAAFTKHSYTDLLQVDLVTYVPAASPKHDINTGVEFDQAKELAKVVSARIGKKFQRTVATKQGASSKHMSLHNRIVKRREDFYSVDLSAELPSLVLLVDDIRTSGGSGWACGGILKKQGAQKVYLLVAGRSVDVRKVDKAKGGLVC